MRRAALLNCQNLQTLYGMDVNRMLSISINMEAIEKEFEKLLLETKNSELILEYTNLKSELVNKFELAISTIERLEKELKITDEILADRQKVLDSIPECNLHGKCVPHALEWINQVKSIPEINTFHSDCIGCGLHDWYIKFRGLPF